MTLRRKLLILIAVAAVLAFGFLYGLSKSVITSGYLNLERQETQKETSTALDMFSYELDQIKSTLLDWSRWDAAYQFAADQNPDFISENINSETFRVLKLNLILYVNSQNQIIYQGGYDLITNNEVSLPDEILASISPDNPLISKSSGNAPLMGYINLKQGPMMVGAASILDSQEQSPSRGRMIIGRYLDATEQENLGSLLHLSLTLLPVNDFLPNDFNTAKLALSDIAPFFVLPENQQVIAGFTQIKDIYGMPSLLLRVEVPRSIYAQGQASQRFYLYFLIGICVAIALGAFITLNYLVVRPVANIDRAVTEISGKTDPSARLLIEGNDEFSSLSHSINKMLEELEHRQQLSHRITQIRTASEISRTINALLDQKELLQQVVNQVAERLDLYYVGVFLVDENRENAVLMAGTGKAGQQMLEANHKLVVGGASMIGRAITTRKSLIALDVGKEAVRFNNPLLPYTRSELALPIISGDEVLGAMTVQSVQARAFDENDIVVLQGIADSLATALKNATLFQQVQANLDEIRSLHHQYLTKSWSEVSRQPGQMSYAYENPQAPNTGESQTILDVPITLRRQVIGHLHLDLGRPALSPSEISLVEAVVNETALALENTRLVEEVQRRAQEQRLISDISAKTQSYLDLETVIKAAVQEIGRAINATKVQIRLGTDSAPVIAPDRDGSPNLN